MPKRFPAEFKRDVVAVARRRTVPLEEVAADFDISVSTLHRWMHQADIDDGIKDGLTSAEQAEIVQLRRDKRRLEMENEILRRAAAYFAQDAPPKMNLPAGPGAGRRRVPVAADLRGAGLLHPGLLQVAPSPVCDRDLDDAHLVNAMVDIHDDDPEFGYRFIWDELEAAGRTIGERRVHRLCKEHRIWSTTTKKGRRGSGKTPGPAVHDDLVQRNFRAPPPTPSGSPTSPSIRRPRASSTAARQGPLLQPHRRLRDRAGA